MFANHESPNLAIQVLPFFFVVKITAIIFHDMLYPTQQAIWSQKVLYVFDTCCH